MIQLLSKIGYAQYNLLLFTTMQYSSSKQRTKEACLVTIVMVKPMKFSNLHQPELEKLCRQYSVKQLAVFGSVATGHDNPTQSDIDFVVEFTALPKGGYANMYFGLLDALQQLYARPVDLVVEAAVKNPYFRQSIEQTKVALYAA